MNWIFNFVCPRISVLLVYAQPLIGLHNPTGVLIHRVRSFALDNYWQLCVAHTGNWALQHGVQLWEVGNITMPYLSKEKLHGLR